MRGVRMGLWGCHKGLWVSVGLCGVRGGYQKWTGREGDVGSQDGRLWNVMKRLWVTEGDCGVSGGVVWCQEGAVGCQEVWVSEGDCGVSGRDCGVPGGEYGVS